MSAQVPTMPEFNALAARVAKLEAAKPPVVTTRRGCDIPFASSSVWDIGIGGNAQWGAARDADVARLRQLGLTINAASWGQPTYFATAADPLVQFHCIGKGPRGDVPWDYAMHCPAGAVAAAGTDRHINLFDSTRPSVALSMFACSYNNGRDVTGGVTSYLGGMLDLRRNGLFAADNDFIGTDNYFGMISKYDLDQKVIRHAVRLALSRNASKSPNNIQGSSIGVPWPNDHVDWDAPSTYTGPILAGSTFGIPASVNVATLGLSQGGMMLAKVLQDYGGIWRDSGGTSQCVFYSTPEMDGHPLIQQMRADGAKIMAVMSIMRNQAANNINGGGARRVPALPEVA